MVFASLLEGDTNDVSCIRTRAIPQDRCPVSAADLARLYSSLGSLSAVARRLNVGVVTVHGWMVNRGIRRKPRGGPNNPKGNPGHRGRNHKSSGAVPPERVV